MDDDQQFCLRWNNHQSTLISVFDTLLENETLVDCTLAAEGRFMKAHKVVLSACSPYFATLLQQQYDKHPIFILKDVKYQELRAMMDYMYRGEVNISQDQLAALLKAAESLQIKGLSDNRSGGSGAGSAPRQEIPHQRASIPGGKHGYTLEQTKRARLGPGSGIEQQEIVSGSREGSSSPSRRRRKPRRRSIDNDVHDNSNSSANQQPNASLAGSAITASALASQMTAAAAAAAAASAVVSPAALASAVVSSQQQSGTQQQQAQLTTNVPKKTETIKGTTSDAMNNENIQATTSGTAIVGSGAAGVVIGSGAATVAGGDEQDNADKVEQKSNHKQKSSNIGKDASTIPSGELTIEPKSEYDDEGNDENVEDLTLDEEEMGMDDLDHNAGTSQGGEGSSQGYAAWQHDNRSQDELLLTTQDAQQRDPQAAGSVSPNNVQDTAAAAAGGATQEHESNAQFKYESKHCMDAYNSESLNFKYDESMQFKADGGSGERFPCAVCGKSYLRKRHLQRHMRDECIGIPPRFSCDLCPSRFRRKYHMVRHLTSKHGIPPAIAQQTTGNSTRNGGGINNNGNANEGGAAGGGGGAYNGSVNGTDSGCDSPLPENLSMRKENYEHDLNLPSPVDMSNVGAVGGIVSAASPIPPAAHVQCPIPTYGLTGAITAISAAAAVVEEQAAAAAAAAAAGIKLEAGSDVLRVAGGIDGIANAENVVQPEIGATAAAVVDGAATGKTLNMMDDDWKMKLSLHLISNSLLKERLMNTMPFAYNNN